MIQRTCDALQLAVEPSALFEFGRNCLLGSDFEFSGWHAHYSIHLNPPVSMRYSPVRYTLLLNECGKLHAIDLPLGMNEII